MITTSTAERVSCPQSMLVSAESATSGTASRAVITDTQSATATHAVLELDAYLPTSPTGAGSFIALSTSAATSGIGLGFGDGVYSLFVQAKSTNIPLSPPLRLGGWNHLKLDVTFSADNMVGSATLTYDADGGGRSPLTYSGITLANAVPITSLSAEVGIDETMPPTVEMLVYFDNVAFTPF
jgi:hypothetical protein